MRVKRAVEAGLRRGTSVRVFAADVEQIDATEDAKAGDVAVLYDFKNRFLAAGLYDPGSPVLVRVLIRGRGATLDAEALATRARDAAVARSALLDRGTDGYRLIHGPGDDLEGLVADRYGDTVVLKVYAAAWLPWLGAIANGLGQEVGFERLVLRLSRSCQEDPACFATDGQTLFGGQPGEPLWFRENRIRFAVDPYVGQKTGFFLDQRENRERVERLAGGARVANLFSYTGGFSLYAARGGAKRVVSVDASGPAVAATRENFAGNREHPAVAACHAETVQADAFEWLTGSSERFDVVVVDPPAFAKRAAEVDGALAAYRRLAELAARRIASGGRLVFASCSSRVGPEAFFAAVEAGVRASGRRDEVTELTGHPLDHPVGAVKAQYLKCRYSRVT